MAYTSTDLTNVEAAITALVNGTRIVSVDIGGKTIQYAPAQLKDLLTLRDAIKIEISETASAPVTRTYVKDMGRGTLT
jgi:hypothetical protein